jgi:NitT/TauT family transport system substrate-binding protein
MGNRRTDRSESHVGDTRFSRRNLLLASGLGLAGAGAALLVGCGKDDGPVALPPPGSQLPPPEVARIRVPGFDGSSLCLSPSLLIDDFLAEEGMEAELVVVPTTQSWVEAVHNGVFDFTQDFAAAAVAGLDQGYDLTVLAGVHAGCLELFARLEFDELSTLDSRVIAVPYGNNATLPDYAFMVTLMNFIGVPAARTVVSYDEHLLPELLASGEVDAVLAYQPLAENLRSIEGVRTLLSTAEDPPWSNYYCCTFTGNSHFVRENPIATLRTLRALMRATDLMATQPDVALARMIERGYAKDDAASRRVFHGLPYGRWRTVHPEDSLRFYALRLREVEEISAAPESIVDSSDWRFLDWLKQDMAFVPGATTDSYAFSCGPEEPRTVRAPGLGRWLRKDS